MEDERLPNIHPGEVLKFEFLESLGITPYRLSKDIGVPQTRVAEIIAGRRGISADTALRLSRYFGTSAEFWLNLQVAYDLREAELTHPDGYREIARSPAVSEAV
jgi:addiction module HigA family antidote